MDENNLTTLAKRLRPFMKMAAQEVIPEIPVDHGALTGLGDDDHSQYIHISSDRSITAQHSFSPSFSRAPFILGTDAQGQTVIGLRADQLNKSISAGAGLTGGGILTGDQSLAVGAGNGIQVNADDVAVKLETTSGLQVGANGLALADAIAGAGLTITSKVLAVGAGAGITVNADDVALTTPGTLTYNSTNSSSGNHTHAITNSSNPGAGASILSTDANGMLTLVTLKTEVLQDRGVTGSILINPTGDISLDPGGNDVLPVTNYEINLGSINKKYLTIHAAELWVETLVAQETIATIGGRILVGPTTELTSDISNSQTNLIINPGFETLGATPPAFADWSELLENSGTVEAYTGLPHSGTYCCVIYNGTAGFTRIFQEMTVTPYTGYTFSFWCRGDSAHAGNYFIWDNSHSNWLITPTSTDNVTADWVRVLVTVKIPAGCTAISPGFSGSMTSYGNYCAFDDVIICQDWMNVKHNQMAEGDIIYFQSAPSGIAQIEFMKIIAGPWGTGPFTYHMGRDLDGTGINAWYQGDAVFNTGQAGPPADGYIDIYSEHSIRSGTQYGPTIVGNIRTGTTYSDLIEGWAIGNLNGLYGYGVDIYGAAFGKYVINSSFLAIDPTNGIRMLWKNVSGANLTLAQWDISGNLIIGQQASGQNNVLITTAGNIAIRNNITNRIYISSAGVFTVNDSDGNAVITLDASAGAEITKKLTMPGASSAISIGVTPPTAYNSGTGIWIDRGGIYGIASNIAQVTLDATTGKLLAGAGNVILDANGIVIKSAYNSRYSAYGFIRTDGTYLGGLIGYDDGGEFLLILGNTLAATTRNQDVWLQAQGYGTYWGRITIQAGDQTASKAARIRMDGSAGRIMIGNVSFGSFGGLLDLSQSDFSFASPVLRMDQWDTDMPFINYVGTSGSGTTTSITTKTTTATIQGHIMIQINGTTRWIPYYSLS